MRNIYQETAGREAETQRKPDIVSDITRKFSHEYRRVPGECAHRTRQAGGSQDKPWDHCPLRKLWP